GQGAAERNRRACHGHGPEPVHDTLGDVPGDHQRARQQAEDGGHREQARYQVFAVAASARHLDRAAEHVAEQHHHHDGEDQGAAQRAGLVPDMADLTPGTRPAVTQCPGEPVEPSPRRARDFENGHQAASSCRWLAGAWGGSAASDADAVRPVSRRKTSSSVGRRRPMSSARIPARSSSRSVVMTAADPPWTGAAIRRAARGGGGEGGGGGGAAPPPPGPAGAGARGPPPTPGRGPPPIWVLSCAEVPAAITRPVSITAMWSASRSASSRYCVVRTTVVPA